MGFNSGFKGLIPNTYILLVTDKELIYTERRTYQHNIFIYICNC